MSTSNSGTGGTGENRCSNHNLLTTERGVWQAGEMMKPQSRLKGVIVRQSMGGISPEYLVLGEGIIKRADII